MSGLRARFASLTARLVLATILLTAVVAVAIGAATAWALHSTLTDQLDGEVAELVERAEGPGGPETDRPPTAPDSTPVEGEGGPCDNPYLGGNHAPGTLAAFVGDASGSGEAQGSGIVVTQEVCGEDQLGAADLALLATVPADGAPRTVDLEVGSYRVVAAATDAGPTYVTGLPTQQVDDAVSSLVAAEVGIGVVAIVVAAAAAALVVRRQLRELREVAATAHEVAALPLAEGEVDLAGRVPARLRDARTEVGQVGAALDTLLSHVEGAIGARQRSEQQVRQFVADASHELRTPLATIAGYAELARRRPGDLEAAHTALAKVESESGRMRRLVEDLLMLARLDAGRPVAAAPVDLTRLLIEAVSDARVLAPEHRWRLDLPGDALEVAGDEHGLHQVVTNLLTNARRHTPASTTVSVTARCRDAHGVEVVEIVVHDDGPGFAPDIVATAFDRFVRADAARTRDAGGSGLGLALVRALVEAHRGTVRLESAPGSTTIRIVLPSSGPLPT